MIISLQTITNQIICCFVFFFAVSGRIYNKIF